MGDANLPRGTIKAFREYLNAKYASSDKHRNGRFEQRTRAYGDYLYSQDREMFDVLLADALAGKEHADFRPVEEKGEHTMIRWLLCKLFGHKDVVKAYTGETMQIVDGFGQPTIASLYKYERLNFCARCGHVPPWATKNTPESIGAPSPKGNAAK